MQQNPAELSNLVATACIDGACEQGTFGSVSPDGGDSWHLALGTCISLSLYATNPSGTLVFFESTANQSCTWFPLKLGDVLRLTLLDAQGDVIFDKSHTVTTQGEDSCGTQCDRLALRF